jgi:hypothetical protein
MPALLHTMHKSTNRGHNSLRYQETNRRDLIESLIEFGWQAEEAAAKKREQLAEEERALRTREFAVQRAQGGGSLVAGKSLIFFFR